MPVYRKVVTKDANGNEIVHYELAAADWKRSDARDVTKWFESENNRQSPDVTNGRQMRRVCRYIKKFSRSRASWKGRMASGFMITKLVTECFKSDAERDDKALYDTMAAIRNRLDNSLTVDHPVTPNETITTGDDDPKARFLRDKLSEALTWLDVLFSTRCSADEAMKAWDKVFYVEYFTDTLKKTKSASAQSSGVMNVGIINDWSRSSRRQAVRKEGGGRYA
jgi:hypothetical protein